MIVEWWQALKRWARRLIVNTINQNMAYDLSRANDAEPKGQRAKFLVLGPGAFHEWPSPDGKGFYCLNLAILELCDDGYLRPMDFKRMFKTHMNVSWLMDLLKSTSHREILCFLAQGVRYKTHAPHEIRIDHNKDSLTGRLNGVSTYIKELASQGHIYLKCIGPASQPLHPDGPCPLITIPLSAGGVGGVDKADDPVEKRVVLDETVPRDDVKSRNTPHGPPTGTLADSLNSMTGSKTGGPRFDTAEVLEYKHLTRMPAPDRVKPSRANPIAKPIWSTE